MRRSKVVGLIAAASLAITACGNSEQVDEPVVDASVVKTQKQGDSMETPGGSPFAFRYEVIGTPIVGSPVTLDLKIESRLGAIPVEIGYQIPDSSSMMLHESQPRSLTVEFQENESFISQRVSVIPLREGRVYLNVSATVLAGGDKVSSATSIPIHVGPVDTGPVEHGEVEITEDGEAVKVLRD